MSDERPQARSQKIVDGQESSPSASTIPVSRDLHESVRERDSRQLAEFLEWHKASQRSGWVLGQPIIR